MNMGEILDPKFKRDGVTTIEDSSCEHNQINKNVEQIVTQTVEDIERSIKYLPDIIERKHEDKVKKKVQKFDIGMT